MFVCLFFFGAIVSFCHWIHILDLLKQHFYFSIRFSRFHSIIYKTHISINWLNESINKKIGFVVARFERVCVYLMIDKCWMWSIKLNISDLNNWSTQVVNVAKHLMVRCVCVPVYIRFEWANEWICVSSVYCVYAWHSSKTIKTLFSFQIVSAELFIRKKKRYL